MDSILWTEESDKYTERALASGADPFDSQKMSSDGDEKLFLDIFSHAHDLAPGMKEVLDVGCCAGGTLIKIRERYADLELFGVDPGKETVNLFNEKNRLPLITLQNAYSHDLPYKDLSFDAIIFSMVLQWIPRKYLIQTIAEVDRVLRTNGMIVIQDFLPNRPVTSVSRHNDQVKIFKEDYTSLFTAFGWYEQVYRQVKHHEKGEGFQKVFSVLRKNPIEDVYLQINPPVLAAEDASKK